ncbi:hypothetical protein [Rhizobium sp. RAF56]|uniref:hypothetical protein n=1 Tax=Rhizobium sp. RAF56 TaxID=3233062 RepID=UPI003F9C92BA
MSEPVSLSRYERARILQNSVVARNDFSAGDKDYFANNGRLVRLRPPGPKEMFSLIKSLELLGYTPFVIIMRETAALAHRPTALIAVKEALAITLPIELARMGDDKTLELLDRKDVKWWPLSAGSGAAQ